MRINRVKVSRIVSVYDGDTFRCDIDTWPKLFGFKIPVRIRGINCCERSSPDAEKKSQAENARRFTRAALINSKAVVLENVQRGKYFRLIADVKCDGRDLAFDLLQGGLAVKYPSK